MKISVLADYREKSSGVPDLLVSKGAILDYGQLYAGDYIVNDEIIIERKTNTDFVHSTITGRLFVQCAKLRKVNMLPLIIVEGNPFDTAHKVSADSIKGALLSVSLAWQIPVILSSGKEDTVLLMLMAARQQLNPPEFIRKTSIKSKVWQRRQHYFIRNLPGVGAKLSQNLLAHFRSIEKIVQADISELLEVDGVGQVKAEKLYRFFRE